MLKEGFFRHITAGTSQQQDGLCSEASEMIAVDYETVQGGEGKHDTPVIETAKAVDNRDNRGQQGKRVVIINLSRARGGGEDGEDEGDGQGLAQGGWRRTVTRGERRKKSSVWSMLLLLLVLQVVKGVHDVRMNEVRVLLEKSVIVVKQKYDIMEVRVQLRKIRIEHGKFEKIAMDTKDPLTKSLREEIAKVHGEKIYALEGQFAGILQTHGLDPLENEMDRTAGSVRGNMLKRFANGSRDERGLFDFLGNVQEVLIGTTSHSTQKKTNDMIVRLAKNSADMAQGMLGLLELDKKLGHMIKNNAIGIVEMGKAIYDMRNRAATLRSNMIDLIWTLKYEVVQNENLWAIERSLNEVLGIIRAGKEGRLDEKLFSNDEVTKILRHVTHMALELGGQTVVSQDIRNVLHKHNHVMTTITATSVAQAIRFPVVTFADVYYQKTRHEWPRFYLERPGGTGKIFLARDVRVSKGCDKYGEWHVCEHREATTWAKGDVYVVEGEDNRFTYHSGVNATSRVTVTCGNHATQKSVPSQGFFKLPSSCAARIRDVFEIKHAPVRKHADRDVLSTVKFHTEKTDSLLAALPTEQRHLARLHARKFELLEKKIEGEHIEIDQQIEEKRKKISHIKGNFEKIEAEAIWTQVMSFGASGVGGIALMGLLVLVCYFCFLANCKK